MSNAILAILMTGALFLTSACATRVRGATQVGGPEDSTWVYVQTSKDKINGIYRCVDADGGVTCTKAKLR